MKIERRLVEPRWLSVAVPVGSIVVAFAVMTIVLLATHHPPGHTFSRLLDTGFGSVFALNQTFVSATPLLFTGLCAAVAFRMQLFNIGGEGQLYAGAIVGAAAGIALGNHSGWLSVPAMIVAGAVGGAALALVPAVLRAFFSTNEIITSLMLNYVGALVIDYLIFDSLSYWRDTSSQSAKVFPQGKNFPDAASWPVAHVGALELPFGLLVGIVLAAIVWVLYTRTRFGFEVQVIGDSPRAATYAGMRTRRKILAVMALSGAVAGLGGASQDGDFRHTLDPRGLTAAGYGYAGIVVAALGRYNPFAVCVIAFLLGGLQNAGYALQGADFPSGLVGVMQGLILFCALGGELLLRYRVRFGRPQAVTT
ncbi:MAG TPA: ABC transporter permease [Gaiellaceae bacterium]|jgi:simple sugar transport system permease protein|nr:ABC transporter permease [Gaiellaceae bacterium]